MDFLCLCMPGRRHWVNCLNANNKIMIVQHHNRERRAYLRKASREEMPPASPQEKSPYPESLCPEDVSMGMKK